MKVLLVEDSRRLRQVLRAMIGRLGDVDVIEAEDVATARLALERVAVDAMILDVRLSDRPNDRGGFDLLRELRHAGRVLPTIVLTSSSELEDVREALRLGARDYLLKDELSAQVLVPLLEELREPPPSRVVRAATLGEVLGSSPAMESLRQLVLRVADTPSTVLLRGETGAGKGLVARALHRASRRATEPFVVVHCAAMPPTLVESSLFGHERGAFTGADRRVRGHLELAAGGTLFLDEIAELPLEMQAKLLHVLDDRTFRPLGAEREVTLRARIVAATHVDLPARIRQGLFREDLYHRLSVVVVTVPSLAGRGEDIRELAEAFAAAQPRGLTFTPEALEWLRHRPWPGNVRELHNVIERLAVLAEDPHVDVATLEALVPPTEITTHVGEAVQTLLHLPAPDGRSRLHMAEEKLLAAAMLECDGNKSAAARLLGVQRKAFQRRLDRLRRSG
ncbi:MAG: sigma-54-dependent Fis family transcriptional regulator [Myxococcales bacterium]|nr:sigma-54-dependent Fis family transcriptional regulator [Myxococcales bacterium]